MNDICKYLIQLYGQADIAEIDAMSPIQMTAVHADPAGTLFSVCTDQSGLIGLMRHLHGLGFVFLSVKRLDPDVPMVSRKEEEPAYYPGLKEA